MIPSSETNNFGFILEFQFGGCGAFQTSINWPTYNANPISATSAAVGFKFSGYYSVNITHMACDAKLAYQLATQNIRSLNLTLWNLCYMVV